MPESLGARLRRQREERQIALATVADETKIKLSLLEALERDDVSRWPTGIFRRAFIRAYAHAIGFDPDVAVREFLELHPDPDETVETLTMPVSGAQAGRAHAAPPTRLRHIVDSAIGSLSRLRHGPAVEEPRAADEAPPPRPAPAEPDAPVDGGPPGAEGPGELTRAVAAAAPPANVTPSPDPDLLAVARLCTELGRVEHANELPPLVEEAARLLHASGIVVWVWDGQAAELRPALAHGYSAKVLAQLPPVTRDADNATAAAFRSGQTCVINGSDRTNGALAVPLLTPGGPAGVLALELRHGAERTGPVVAVATILAALLAQLTGGAPAAEARPGDLTMRRAASGGG